MDSWLHTAPGLRAQLVCRVNSWPEATLDWYLDGERVGRSQRVVRYKQEDPKGPGQLHSLLIRGVNSHELGMYTCRASNELGSGEASVELSGLAKRPLLKKEPKASSSTSCNFIWEVDSYTPVVEYQLWFRQVKLSLWLTGIIDAPVNTSIAVSGSCEFRGKSQPQPRTYIIMLARLGI